MQLYFVNYGQAFFGCPTLSVFTIIDGVRINDTVESRFAIVALICVLAGIGLIYAWDKWRVLNFDLKKGYVSSLNGIVDVRHERHRNGFRYSIKLPNMTFHDVAWAIVNNIHPGEEYTIYYVPSSLRILSFEPFDGEV